MDRRNLGKCGWSVGEIGCGTYRSFDRSGAAAQKSITRLVGVNLAAGVDLFDTAPMYGLAETTLGRAISAAAASDRPIVATKVLQNELSGAKSQIEDSFGLLGRIDLLQVHNMAGWRVVVPYLAELRAQGRIGAVGVTHYDPGAFGEIEVACKTGQVDVIQIPYNLMERQVERRLLPMANDMNLGVLVMTPIQPIFRRSELLNKLAGLDLAAFREYGVSDTASLCLKYLLSKDLRLVPIPATSRDARAVSNTNVSGKPPLPRDLIRRLEQLAGS